MAGFDVSKHRSLSCWGFECALGTEEGIYSFWTPHAEGFAGLMHRSRACPCGLGQQSLIHKGLPWRHAEALKSYWPKQDTPGCDPGVIRRNRSPKVTEYATHHKCALGGTRTPNLLIRSQMLYPLSYKRLAPISVLGAKSN